MADEPYTPIITVLTSTQALEADETHVPVQVLEISNVLSVVDSAIGGVKVSPENGKYSGSLVLEDGDNVITVAAANEDGDGDEKTFTINAFDPDRTYPPVLTVLVPPEALVTIESEVPAEVLQESNLLSVIATEIGGVQVSPEDGKYAGTLPLEEGENVITIVAANEDGDTDVKTITITAPNPLWLYPPILTVLTSTEDLFTNRTGSPVEVGGGSNLLDIVQVTIDGADIPMSGGKFAREMTLTEGENLVTVRAETPIGEGDEVDFTITRDTVAPEISFRYPDEHRVVDVAEYPVMGWVSDAGSGVDYVASGSARASPGAGGFFVLYVPLEIGENTFTVTVYDRAGNTAAESFYMIRLITHRVKSHPEAVAAFYQKPVIRWTAEDHERFQTAILWGAYTEAAVNRVGIAARYLKGELEKRGYAPDVRPKTDWTRNDVPTLSQANTYVANVRNIRDAQQLRELAVLPIPNTLRFLDWNGANQLEKALVEADSFFPNYQYWGCGEIGCGES